MCTVFGGIIYVHGIKWHYLCVQYMEVFLVCSVYGGICMSSIWRYQLSFHMYSVWIYYYSGHSFIFLMQISKSPAQTQLHDKILAPGSHHQKELSSPLHTVILLSSVYKQYAVSSCAPSSGEYRQLELYHLTLCLCRRLGALCIKTKLLQSL